MTKRRLIEDVLDDENDILTSQSPYFTQVTQPVRDTQPTQIICQSPDFRSQGSAKRSKIAFGTSSTCDEDSSSVVIPDSPKIVKDPAPLNLSNRAQSASSKAHADGGSWKNWLNGNSKMFIDLTEDASDDAIDENRQSKVNSLSPQSRPPDVTSWCLDLSKKDEVSMRGHIRPSAFMKRVQGCKANGTDGSVRLRNARIISSNAKSSSSARSRSPDKVPDSDGATFTSPKRPNIAVSNFRLGSLQNRSPGPVKFASDRPFHLPAHVHSRLPAQMPSLSFQSSQNPRPRLKRLVRGLRRPSSSSIPSQIGVVLVSDDESENDGNVRNQPPAKRMNVAPPSVDLSDESEAFVSDGSDGRGQKRSFGPDAEYRMLKYLNECDAVQLRAITQVKAASAKAMLDHKPFKNFTAALKVSVSVKKGKKQVKRALGEEVVEALQNYIGNLDRVAEVIAKCGRKARKIKLATSKWRLDTLGQDRNVHQEHDRPPTPSTADEPFEELPIPNEPAFMQGHCSMKPYQVYGMNWMYQLFCAQHGAILADDMGLGKTCQVIAFISALINRWEDDKVDWRIRAPKSRGGNSRGDRPWPNLIVVPPSTLENWQLEFARFAPELRVTTYSGTVAERANIAEEILADDSEHHVVLTTYSQLKKTDDLAALRRIQPVAAIFDEGQRLKNPTTQEYQGLRKIPASFRLLLSGTPVQNNIMEMISLLCFIQPDLAEEHREDLDAFFRQKLQVSDISKGVALQSERVAQARNILEPFILQRKKQQVLKDLPAKTNRLILCDASDRQMSIYRQYQKRFRQTAIERAGSVTVKPEGRSNDENNVWMQLRKAAIHPMLFRMHFDDASCRQMAKVLINQVPYSVLKQANEEHMTQELKNSSDFELHLWCRDYPRVLGQFDCEDGAWFDSGKIKALLGLVEEFKKNGDRVLVFTKFAKVLEIISECLNSKEVAHLTLLGSTSVGERQDLINEFTENEEYTVFLLTTGAGGTGINLAAANKIVIFDMSDNPQEDVQAENRAHRLGQKRPVEVIRLITRGTVEEVVHEACMKKLELAEKVTGFNDVAMESGEMEATVRQSLQSGEISITPASDD